jgi:hypothetical protein
MQDSTVDWATEYAKMDIVFLNAAVTIAACVCSDADRGSSLDHLQPAHLRLCLPIRDSGRSPKLSHIKGTLGFTYRR